LDAFADYFGIETYQLFQPGISQLTERRSGGDRRATADRRVNATLRGLPSTPVRQIAVTPDDEAILADLHALSYENYQRVKGWITVARLGTGNGRKTPPPPGPPPTTPGSRPPGPPRLVPPRK
jgi:hypothetical protein